MGIGALDYKKGGSGLDINGLIEDYYVYAGEKVSAGDFVEFINGVASESIETSTLTSIVSSANVGQRISACKLSEDKIFIAHNSGTGNNSLHGIVCTINNSIIIRGADTTILSGNYTGNCMSVVALSETSVFISYSKGSNYYLCAIVCTIDGTTITAGTSSGLSSQQLSSKYSVSSTVLKNGNVFVAHSYASSALLRGIVCSVNGTTITAGTDTVLSSETHSGYFIETCLTQDGNVFVAHSYASSRYLYGIVCPVEGTTITAGTDKALVAIDSAGNQISMCLLENGKIFIAHCWGRSICLYGIICTVTNTTITRGTSTQLSTLDSVGNVISVGLLDNGDVFIAHSNSDYYYLYGMVCSVNNTTITSKTDVALCETQYTGEQITTLMLGTRIFIAHSYSSNRNLYGQIWNVDKSTDIVTNEIAITTHEIQVRPATSLPCNGVAKSSGEGGDSTGHKDVVSVYISDV